MSIKPGQLRMQYVGCLGLLAECAVYLPDKYEGEELRQSIEHALEDAERVGIIKWCRVLNRMEVSIP